MNKISEEHLKTIQNQQGDLSKILNQVGYLESQKHALLHELASVNQEVEEFKKVLEAEYGSININVEDGSYTEVETEQKQEAHV